MKKSLTLFALLCVIAAFSCTGALAARGNISNVTQEDGVEVKPDGEVTDGVYKNADKLQVIYSKAEEGRQYLILLLSAAPETSETGDIVLPTKSSIFSIDQTDDADIQDGKVTFQLYPRVMSAGQYYLYLSAAAVKEGESDAQTGAQASLAQIGSFQYAAQKRYYGDANGDEKVTIEDITALINDMVDNKLTPEQKELSNADGDTTADGSPMVTINDFTLIINAMVDLRPLEMPS